MEHWVSCRVESSPSRPDSCRQFRGSSPAMKPELWLDLVFQSLHRYLFCRFTFFPSIISRPESAGFFLKTGKDRRVFPPQIQQLVVPLRDNSVIFQDPNSFYHIHHSKKKGMKALTPRACPSPNGVETLSPPWLISYSLGSVQRAPSGGGGVELPLRRRNMSQTILSPRNCGRSRPSPK